MAKWYVYIVQAANGRLYTGISTDPKRRLEEHRTSKKGAKFFRSAGPPSDILYLEELTDRSSASKREHEIKSMPRSGKFTLITEKRVGESRGKRKKGPEV